MTMRGRAREALLEAATGCVRDLGYAGTTQAAVIARSGANPRSVTYHFGSFDRLRAEALVAVFRERAMPIGEAGSIAQFVDVFLEALRDITGDRESALALPEAVVQARDDELRALFADHYATVRGEMAGVVDRVAGDRLRGQGADPTVLATALMALFDGLVLQWLLDPAALPDGRAVLLALSAGFSAAAPEELAG